MTNPTPMPPAPVTHVHAAQVWNDGANSIVVRAINVTGTLADVTIYTQEGRSWSTTVPLPLPELWAQGPPPAPTPVAPNAV